MKKTLIAFLITGFVALQSCEGPQGPAGLPGQDATNIVSEVFEQTVNFTQSNNYEEVFNFTPPIFTSDVVLVFLEWETQNNNSIWRALPQTVFLEEGVLIYNFDFSRQDFRLFLETTFNAGLLPDVFTRNQKFRVVIVPGEFANARIDFSDYEAVMNLIGAKEGNVVDLDLRK
ncbi:hypothetical protein P872_23990 [Rhodonellum psychrophilum GCM71 = DSM 17998]|uniref:Dihydrolipoamide dehydrogenase n=2 Tax=Rhodonellum TaxID=336827 RepID=U5C403_9BACT|nr:MULTISPECIES: hypothetical protein [Rhodonellum]ERM84773.1 hypothetical protein P872_23990 [Rhodonellum psychrophilum GCM71 = DSM 17998]MDO9551311.1 hypothetical protein [Rhodonellum sp.]SDZ11615.1 hypothetical protein SAMN05444412_10639 [Rhodonellum ikkaensis]